MLIREPIHFGGLFVRGLCGSGQILKARGGIRLSGRLRLHENHFGVVGFLLLPLTPIWTNVRLLLRGR